MMREQPKATGHFAGAEPGANDGSTFVRGVRETPPTITLTEAGIDKNLAKRSRSLARAHPPISAIEVLEVHTLP
jgi:hypothetical protein